MTSKIAALYQYHSALAQEAVSDPGAVSPQLADKFQALMAEGTEAQSPTAAGLSHGFVQREIELQADEYRRVPNDILYASQHMNAMTMQQVMAANMTVELEVAGLNADLQVKMATVQSSKEAVQTLMKNQ